MSARDQDWIYKIDYANGAGTATILWRMGAGGDFTFVNTSDPYPWFSGQHDPEFLKNGVSLMTVFDDGDTRVSENARTVSYALNADLGVFSYALGSASQLSNGDFYFDAGEIEPSKAVTQLIEVNSSGAQTYNEEFNYACYRSFRLTDFYNVSETN